MRDIIHDINQKEADRTLYTDFTQIVANFVDIVGAPKGPELNEYLSNLYLTVLQARLSYLGTVRAWLDTLPENMTTNDISEVERLTKAEIESNVLLYDAATLQSFVGGYCNGMAIICQEYGAQLPATAGLDTYNSVVAHIGQEGTQVVDNMFKVYGLYDQIALRQGAARELRLVHMPMGNSFQHHLN